MSDYVQSNIRFLSEQYLSGTLFLKPASTWKPSPHSRRSSVTNPERCAPHPPIVVIRESGLTIIELELELEPYQITLPVLPCLFLYHVLPCINLACMYVSRVWRELMSQA